MNRCKDCAHWFAIGETRFNSKHGECRRYPPKRGQLEFAADSGKPEELTNYIDIIFTESDYYCGEFKRVSDA